MLELFGPEETTSDDPLAAALGIGTSTTAPTDPALARLFPDGYTDDPRRRRTSAATPRPGCATRSGPPRARPWSRSGSREVRQVLDLETAQAWLRALNDTRLVLGQRLGVTEDFEELIASLEEDDPRLGMFWVYDRLTFLQETLVRALW